MMRFRTGAVLMLSAATSLGGIATAEESDMTPTAFADGLSGRDIYARVLDNHLSTSRMEQRTLSEDPSGDRQESRFRARFKDYRVDGRPGKGGVISKAIMKYTFPESRRDAGYLFIEKHRVDNEGFNYSRARGKVMRMRTNEETVFGTDFTLEDIVAVRVLDDATYERRSDEELEGVPVYVVMVTYLPESRPQYQKSLMWIDQEFMVPLKIVNWGHDGARRNTMETSRRRIEWHDDAWVPMEVVMKDLRDHTTSWLYTDALDANPTISDREFQPTRLGRGRR